jgi:predicted MFS family arabinose efflux permease
MRPLHGRTLVAAMCVAQVCNLLPHVVVPGIMAHHLIPLWQLTAAQAGLMASAYAFGYMLAVPVLTALSDHFDARRILLAGSAVSGLATIAFGILAEGLWSASLLWGIAGAGFGGAYMPGLKALTDRLPPGDMSRSVTLYTSSFSVGVGLSFLISQLVADYYGWRDAFFVTGIAPFAMVATSFLLEKFKPKPAPGHPLDFRPVIRNRVALGYIFGYGAHCFELYGMRTWIVSFWTFLAARNANDVLLGPVAISVLITLLSLPAIVLGNEAVIRFGRHRAIVIIMFLSAVTAVAIGLTAVLSPIVILLLLLVYGLTVAGESGALTSGMTVSSNPAQRGATMALHSTVGFGLSALGAWGTGVALDLAGGPSIASGWLAAFSLLGAGILLGPLALWWSRAGPTERG